MSAGFDRNRSNTPLRPVLSKAHC